MRKTLLIILVIFLFNSCGSLTYIEAEPELMEMQEILEVPGKTKSEIYILANEWFVKTFASAESVIEFQDKEAGKIMGKYGSSGSWGIVAIRTKSTIDVDIKDDKLRITCSDPMVSSFNSYTNTYSDYSSTPHRDIVLMIREEWETLIVSLKSHLEQSNTDW